MERNLPAPDQQRTAAPISDLNQSTPSSFDFLISYDTDIRAWEPVEKELASTKGKSTESRERLEDLRGRRLLTNRTSKQRAPVTGKANVTSGQTGLRSSLPQEIPVRDSDGVRSLQVPHHQPVISRNKDDGAVNLLSPYSLPSSPVDPTRDPRGAPLLSEAGHIISGDHNTARYLRILVPHRDSSAVASDAEEVCSPPRLSASLNYSELDPFEAPASFAENLLLESPSDSPSHFSRLRLSLSTGESETDTSVTEPPSSESILRTPFPIRRQDLSQNVQLVKAQKPKDVPTKKRRSSARKLLSSDPQHHRYTTKTESVVKVPETTFHAGDTHHKPIQKPILDEGTIHNLEREIKRLVVEVYSEKEHRFVPIPGLKTTRMDQQQPSQQQGVVDAGEQERQQQHDSISVLKDAFQLESTVGPGE